MIEAVFGTVRDEYTHHRAHRKNSVWTSVLGIMRRGLKTDVYYLFFSKKISHFQTIHLENIKIRGRQFFPA